MKKQGDQMTNDLARLRGARFVTTSETDQGLRLPTNHRAILYGEFFSFVPTF